MRRKKMTEKEIETAYKEMMDAFDEEVRSTACSSCGNYTFTKKDYSFEAFAKELGNNLEKYNWDIHETIYQASPECISESLKWINGIYGEAHHEYHNYPFMDKFKSSVTEFMDEIMKIEAEKIIYIGKMIKEKLREKPKKEPRIIQGSPDQMYSENTIYITNTGRHTTPVPWFTGKLVANNIKKLERWQVENCILEASARGDWFNLLWMEELKRRIDKKHGEFTVTPSEKFSLELYLFDTEWVFKMPYKMTREV